MIMRFLSLWDRTERVVAGLLGLGALAIALWQVAARYLFPEVAISYAEEVIVYLIIWATMIVCGELVRSDGHVRPDLVLNFLPPQVARWVEVFNCIAALAFCGALVWYGYQIVDIAVLIDERSSSDLQFPMWIYYAALPAGGALMFINYGRRLAGLLLGPDTTRMSLRHHDMQHMSEAD